MRRPASEESGIALLIVLLAITLLTIVVIEFTDTTQVETHLAFSARNALQATYLARSGINVAEALVSVDGLLSPGYDGGQEDFWARPYPPLPIGDGTATFRVRDEARFLNLNDMFSSGTLRSERLAVFRRLFTVLGIDPRILMAIVDWMDADGNPMVSPPGAEQPFYLGLRPPVVVRNGPLLTLRELLLVRGVTPTVLARLEGFVTVLPPAGNLKININTARSEVLAALSDDMLENPALVEHVTTRRATATFMSPTDLKEAGLERAYNGIKDFVDVNSPYFRLEGVGEVDEVRRGIIEVVKRDGKRITRISWTPSNANLTLTSLPPSDFLATLPVFGDR